jgi:hypothetical protein
VKKNKLPKARKGAWFVSTRGSYIPVSWQGWLLYIPYILLIALSFFTLFNSVVLCATTYECGAKTTISMAIFNTILLTPFLVALVVIMHWIAKRKS